MAHVTTTVRAVRRLTNSASGNPRYLIATADGTFHTAADAQVVHTVSWDTLTGKNVELTVTGVDAWVIDLAVVG